MSSSHLAHSELSESPAPTGQVSIGSPHYLLLSEENDDVEFEPTTEESDDLEYFETGDENDEEDDDTEGEFHGMTILSLVSIHLQLRASAKVQHSYRRRRWR